MQIDSTVLSRLETLSYLSIDADKKEALIEQLSEIVQYVENLNELDTDHLESTFSTLPGGTPLRTDVPHPDPSVAENILANAPRAADDFFIVPAIID